MKKLLILLLALAMLVPAALAEEAPTFEALSELNWTFMSGAGGWSTDMQIAPDGSFTGNYHDSEMGETGDDYPDGTLYGCTFHGQFTLGEQVNEYTWKVHVDALELDEGQVPEAIEDGVRYVTIDPYGLVEGHDMLLYLPGTPTDALPEEFLFWAHLIGDEIPEALPYYGLYDETDDMGFIGEEPYVEETTEG